MPDGNILVGIFVIAIILIGIWITVLVRTKRPTKRDITILEDELMAADTSDWWQQRNLRMLREAPFIAIIDPAKREELRKRLLIGKNINLAVGPESFSRERLMQIPGVIDVVPNTTVYALVNSTKFELGVPVQGGNAQVRGKGTLIYVLDTGVNCIPVLDEVDMTGDGPRDVADHGTWVASAIKEIVPDADIISVKVLGDDGSAPTAVIAAGLDYVYQDTQKRYLDYDRILINMSLGGMPNEALDHAVGRADEFRVLTFAAAGNNFIGRVGSPGQSPVVITVGALDNMSRKANFSQYQQTISKPEVSTPGVSLDSTGNRCNMSTKSGTSMATPIAVGLTAYALQDQRGNLAQMTSSEFQDIKQRIIYSGGETWRADGTGFSHLNLTDLQKSLE